MAGANLNPAYVTAAMWWLWDYVDDDPQYGGVRLGGIYADKPGNHNTVLANLARWPNNYSVRNPIDRRDPKTKARAIDYTMNDAGMRLMTGRLVAGVKRNDPRLACVKEFYGSVNGVDVVGWIKDDEDGPWRTATSDSSHTWHVHLGILTPYVDDMEAMRGLASLLSGESLDDYIGGIVEQNLPKHGDRGTWVGFFQRLVIDNGATLPKYGPDNAYGDEFASALRWWWKNVVKSSSAYDGRVITSDVARHLIRGAMGVPTQAQVDAAVAKYLQAHPVPPGKTPTKVTIDFPAVTGTVTASQ